ncbi:siderophore ferric iron reductase [Aeromonas encheleia]|uniref:Siderophore ferric iron reductase n=1 Tax=Aeromonas encheleia TaxID=73010 RepID=A0AAE9MKY0_9GAMM|nr:siderophore ferric iron reductase [Aeromonas encheleia]USV59203.1 siderophore ferric iron reductase [Aeromonas encheleia]
MPARGGSSGSTPPGFGGLTAHRQARHQAEHDALFAAAVQLIPSLKGRLVAGEMPLLAMAGVDMAPGAVTLALHDHWRLAHPEAGPAYWLTRSWGMLCWQSIYLAMVAVYRIGAVPALDRMGQGYNAGLVSGFSLPLVPMIKGEREVLIEAAGRRLRRHWQALFEAMASGQRLRPGFVRPLLADDLLAALVRVPDFFDEVSREQVAADAPLWLAACGLPAEHLAGWCLAADPAGGASAAPGYVRQRCCLHHKRSDGSLCDNCPRQQDPQARCGDGVAHAQE